MIGRWSSPLVARLSMTDVAILGDHMTMSTTSLTIIYHLSYDNVSPKGSIRLQVEIVANITDWSYPDKLVISRTIKKACGPVLLRLYHSYMYHQSQDYLKHVLSITGCDRDFKMLKRTLMNYDVTKMRCDWGWREYLRSWFRIILIFTPETPILYLI